MTTRQLFERKHRFSHILVPSVRGPGQDQGLTCAVSPRLVPTDRLSTHSLFYRTKKLLDNGTVFGHFRQDVDFLVQSSSFLAEPLALYTQLVGDLTKDDTVSWAEADFYRRDYAGEEREEHTYGSG